MQDSYFGLTSFIEKPIHPVGQTSKNSDGSPTNYVYKLHTSLTNDYNQLLQAVTSVTTTGNQTHDNTARYSLYYR